jgi:glycosyltransferase involved in cell wall biosynthesis
LEKSAKVPASAKVISVVIPTYNRAAILQRTLEKLNEQTLPPELAEIIVVSDGSTDNTKTICENFRKKSKYEFHFIEQSNKGQASARNAGIEKAKHDNDFGGRKDAKRGATGIIIFIGDDIIPQHNHFLENHLKVHQKYPSYIIIGETTWDPELKITPFMKWLEEGTFQRFSKGGAVVAFHHLKKRPMFDSDLILRNADIWHFYGGNISIPANALKQEKFSEDFKGYGWEDIELGARLIKNHFLKIAFTELCPAYHYHEITEEDFYKRLEEVKKTAEIFQQKHPEIKIAPTGGKKMIFKIVSSEPILFMLKLLPGEFFKRLYWWARMKK